MSTQSTIYLDYASTTPVDPIVASKMMEFLTPEGEFGNPASRSHRFGWKADEAVEEARSHVANLVNCDPREIVWTSGATEADNLAIKGVARFYKSKGNHIITSKIEHKAVLDPCRQLEREGFEVTYLDPDEKGIISASAVKDAIKDTTVLVSIMHVNNELGTVNDIANIGPLLSVIGTVFAYFSIVILSFGDFSRYVKNTSELNKGNLSLILNLVIFSFFALFIVIGVVLVNYFGNIS